MRKTAIIVDLDDTLLDSRDIEKYIPKDSEDQNTKEAWSAFHSNLPKCFPNRHIYMLVYGARLNYDNIFFITAREDLPAVRSLTDNALRKMNFKKFTLLMRPEGNYENPEIVKQLLYDKYVKSENWKIDFAIDDNPVVNEMWRRNGINTLTCGYGICTK